MIVSLESPINTDILHEASAFYSQLPTVPPGALQRVYLHWTAGPYSATFPDYNATAMLQDSKWIMVLTHDPADNARMIPAGATANVDYAAHTYKRNSHALAVAIAAMLDASPSDFGACPITAAGVEHVCAMAAAFCRKYDIDSGANLGDGEFAVMTHAETAIQDGYFGEKWDFALLEPGYLTIEGARDVATQLRQRVHMYAARLP